MNCRSPLRRWSLRLSIAYLSVVASACIWLWLDAEDRAPTALFLYGPRWVAALPMILLIPLAALSRSWWCCGLVASTALGIAGPLMGGRLTVASQFDPPPAYARYRVVTWNAGGVSSTEAFRKFQNETLPDIVLIQESPVSLNAADFPPGWKLVEGPSGLRLASRYPVRLQESIAYESLPLPGCAARFTLDTPDGQMTVCNVHLPTVRPGIEVALASKLANLTELRNVLPMQAKASNTVRNWVGDPIGLTIVAGDFNMTVDNPIYKRDWSAYQNAFSETGNGWGGTKMTSWHRVRIDQILYGTPLHCRHCVVGPDLGSDHRPVLADLTLEDGV